MSTEVARFTITKDLDNTFIFTIKADGSTLPMTIEAADTFYGRLINLEDGSVVLNKSLSVLDALSGKVSLEITSIETSALVSEKGEKADRYYLRPVYKLIIDCDTENNGKFIAKVPEVYVD
jgi:hypothetical protein